MSSGASTERVSPLMLRVIIQTPGPVYGGSGANDAPRGVVMLHRRRTLCGPGGREPRRGAACLLGDVDA
jgi:hypothetical protein